MRFWSAGLVLAACGGGSPAGPIAKPVVAPVAAPIEKGPAPVAPKVPWPDLNLGFEQANGDQPAGWTNSTSYEWRVVTSASHGGARSLQLRSAGDSSYGAALISVPAASVRGMHLTLRGWIKTEDIRGGAALFLAAEGGRAFDDMDERRVIGTEGWTEASVEIDVPDDSEQVVFGPTLFGRGTAWFDDLRLEVADRPRRHPIVLEGTVVDARGASVAGADVALVSFEGLDTRVRSDPRGRFHFDAMSGSWGFSANHPGSVGGFLDRRQFDADAKAIRLALGGGDGVVVQGTLVPAPPGGAYVTLSPVSAHDADIFAVPVAPDGTFKAMLPRVGTYDVRVTGGAIGEAYAKRVGDRAEVVVPVTVLAPPPAEVVAWIGAHAIPLATTEAGHGFDDIAPLGTLVGRARVVGLGEATHGTREFFQLKHRVLEYLVSRHGFTVFAIEANQPECRAINDYVLHGKGDPRAGLDELYFWTWNTEEVLAMIEWMRAWNADPRHRNKVQFRGFDMQTTKVAHASVAAYLAKVTPEAAPGLMAPIEALAADDERAAIRKLGDDGRRRVIEGLAAIASAFDGNREAWVQRTTRADFDEMRHDLTILEQATTLYAPPRGLENTFNIRDRAMAANIRWILDHQPPGSRMVVWAHNGHVANRFQRGVVAASMGSELRKQLRADYVNLGFVLSQGSFQAIVRQGSPRGELTEITLGAPPESYLSVGFARTGKPLLVLDLRALPRQGIVRDWFVAPHLMREAGALFVTEKRMTVATALPELYDAVIFVDQTTRARPNHARR